MAFLLRRLLTETIERQEALKVANDPIFGIIGLGEGPVDGITSENLDEYLYPYKAWSYTDCACLALAQQRNVQQAFAFDHHFTQMGLQIVP